MGARGLASVQAELERLEEEEGQIKGKLVDLAKQQAPVERVSDDARTFLETWQDIGELLVAATPEERMQILQHYIEVIELGPIDPETRTGSYAMRLFPEVRPDRGFDFGGEAGPVSPSPAPETTNGIIPESEHGSGCVNPGRLGSHNRPESSQRLSQLEPGLIERGTFRLSRLRRAAVIEFIPWNGSSNPEPEVSATPKEPRDPFKLARYYQSMLNSGQFENRAALARYLGDSRARVTQVLKRLSNT